MDLWPSATRESSLGKAEKKGFCVDFIVFIHEILACIKPKVGKIKRAEIMSRQIKKALLGDIK